MGKRNQSLAGQPGYVQTYAGSWVPEANAVLITTGGLSGQYAHKWDYRLRRLVSGEVAHATDEANLVFLTVGMYRGRWTRRDDAFVRPLVGGGYCYIYDSYGMVWGSDEVYYHPDQGLDYVFCVDAQRYAPRSAATPAVYYAGMGANYVIDASHSVYCESNDTRYYSEEVARASGIEWSDRQDAWWETSRPDFADARTSAAPQSSPSRRSSRWSDLDSGSYNAGYHDSDLPRVNKAGTARFTAGFEVEKEDRQAMESVYYRRLYAETEWAKERDGSLSDSSGYELVSPTYDLMSDQLDEALQNENLRLLINGDFSIRCGGHIHFGIRGMRGSQILDHVSGYLPVLYGMFPTRARARHNNYCRGKKVADLKDDSDKYQSVRLFSDRIELRIFGPVRNVDNLLWRRDLLRHMAEHPLDTQTVLNQMTTATEWLYGHFAKIYTDEKLLALVARAATFAREIEEDESVVAPTEITNPSAE